MKTLLILFVFTAGILSSYGQQVLNSTLNIETCYGNQHCSTTNNSGILFYDDSKSALYLKVDFQNEEDSMVEWLKDLPDESLYFKVVVPADFFKDIANYNQKSIPLNGIILFNGFWKPQTVDIGLVSSENSNIVINTNNNDSYESFKINFVLSVLPSDFYVAENGPPGSRETISVSLSSGRVNLLKPGMEGLLGKAYNQE